MRRVVRRKDTLVTIQTWTHIWIEDVPASEPSLAGPSPEQLPSPAPQTPDIVPETPPASSTPNSNTE